jgi:hypothetical protein
MDTKEWEIKLDEITRIEIIDWSLKENNRVYVNMNTKDVKLSFQDNWRTLKIFTDKNE